MELRERVYFIIFVYYANIKAFHYIYFSFLYLLMFPFCLHATSVLFKLITVLFCIIKRF